MKNKMKNMLKISAFALVAGAGVAQAAIPVEVTDAIDTLTTDVTGIVLLLVGALVLIIAAKFGLVGLQVAYRRMASFLSSR